jgi:glycosyltransferase involved in cell wall biosynthesis
MASATLDTDPVLSFVVIGYNEAKTLGACLRSVCEADIDGLATELIYVDAGSSDDSLAIAKEVGVDHLLGGDRQRRAAENRNLGLNQAAGAFVQFVDGDMVLAPDWPRAAYGFLQDHSEVAAVCGNLDEKGQGILFDALQIDWAPREGYIRHCGGAAMWRRDVLETMGGFPEDVAYGEEPYLCWRVRNEQDLKFYQIKQRMADHDLGFAGFGDYWRRNVRCGQTYAEISSRCRHTADRLWLKEFRVNLAWAAAMMCALILMLVGPLWLSAVVAVVAALVLLRKAIMIVLRGYSPAVAVVYAVHTYFSKIAIAWGEATWILSRSPESTRETNA